MTKTVNSKAEFTATEDRLIEILTRGLNEVLENSWRDLMPVTFKEQGREVNPQFASFVDGADTVIICSFVVQLPNIDPATFQIILSSPDAQAYCIAIAVPYPVRDH